MGFVIHRHTAAGSGDRSGGGRVFIGTFMEGSDELQFTRPWARPRTERVGEDVRAAGQGGGARHRESREHQARYEQQETIPTCRGHTTLSIKLARASRASNTTMVKQRPEDVAWVSHQRTFRVGMAHVSVGVSYLATCCFVVAVLLLLLLVVCCCELQRVELRRRIRRRSSRSR